MFSPEIIHIKCENNSAADTLSCLPKVGPEVEPKEKAYDIFAQDIDKVTKPLLLSMLEQQKRQIKINK